MRAAIRIFLAVTFTMGIAFLVLAVSWNPTKVDQGNAGGLIGAVFGRPAYAAGSNSRLGQANQTPLPPIFRDTFTPTFTSEYPPVPPSYTPTRTPYYPPIITRTPIYPPRITPTYTRHWYITATYPVITYVTVTPVASLTSVASPTPTETPTPVLLPPEAKTLTPACTDYVAGIIGQAMELTNVQFLTQQAPKILAGVEGEQVCGQDAACWNRLLLENLTRGFVESAFQANPGLRPPVQVIAAMARLFDEPQATTLCLQPAVVAWEMALQFSIRGSGIDGFSLHSPAHLRVRDFEGKESAFRADGRISQDIPGSLARKAAGTEYIFLPSKKTSSVEVEGTADGEVTLDAVQNTQQAVRKMTYSQVPVTSTAKGSLKLDRQPPQLEIQAMPQGQLASFDPTSYQEFAIQASVAPVTATPVFTATYTPAPSPTAAWQEYRNPPILIGAVVVCIVGFVAGIIASILMQVLFGRKKLE